VYFAASVDDAETNKKFAEHVEADYPILSDPEKKAATAYGVVDAQRQLAARWTFYIGPERSNPRRGRESESPDRG
jgi:thioredoxin-dependent peroxiredoxin